MNNREAVPQLTETNFQRAFERFKAAVKLKSGKDFVNFSSGLVFEWEGYKDWVYQEGRHRLAVSKWRRSKMGILSAGETKSIFDDTVSAIEIHKDSLLRNNLVRWDARYGQKGKSHIGLLTADDQTKKRLEKVLYSLYKDGEPEDRCFDELVAILGRKFDLLAYLFFLKDWTRFMPISPKLFSKAFDHLGIPQKLSGRCSWSSYTGYLDRLNLVKEKLNQKDLSDRLIDAHSFCYVLASLWETVDAEVKAVWMTGLPVSVTRNQLSTRPARQMTMTSNDFLEIAKAKNINGGSIASVTRLNDRIEASTQAKILTPDFLALGMR